MAIKGHEELVIFLYVCYCSLRRPLSLSPSLLAGSSARDIDVAAAPKPVTGHRAIQGGREGTTLYHTRRIATLMAAPKSIDAVAVAL